MQFFARGSLYDISSPIWNKIHNPVPAKFKHVINIVTCTLLWCNVMTYVPALKFPKSWFWTILCQPKRLFPIHGVLAWNICLRNAPCMLMYSAVHIMQWFSDCLDVFTLKIGQFFFYFYIFMNQNKYRLHKYWTKYNYSVKLICFFEL